jgi:SGNH hydrolase-like domain, acetyltransferase AlgX
MSEERDAALGHVNAPRSPRALVRRVAGTGALLVASFAAALLLAEFAVRLAAPQQLILIEPALWKPADSLGHERRANVTVRLNTGERTVTVRTDADGFRIGAAGRREAGTEVLLIGDSFMEALQVDHELTTAALLEQGLERALRRPVAVRNAGVAGWGPTQYLIRTRSLVARDVYALVVVSVFVGNDAMLERREYIPPRAPAQRARLRLPRRPSAREFVDALAKPMNDALEVRSHLYILLKNQLGVLRMRLGLTADYLPDEYRREQRDSARWRVTAGVAREIAAVAATRGIPTLFVLVPEQFQVDEAQLARYLQGFGIDPAAVDAEQPSRELRQAFMAEGLNVIDALAPMRAEAARGAVLFGNVDHHLSPAGHEVLAELLTPEAARLLLPVGVPERRIP